jgi:endonuclease YncB( thermonuclease family)
MRWQETVKTVYATFGSAVVFAFASSTAAEPIAGRASVIDGDTLEIRGTRIRLHGVDAPESGQYCLNAADRLYLCGQRAALALADKIGANNVSCEERDKDRYGRVVAVCRQGGEDLNAWLVIEGLALAYRRYGTDYAGEENEAREKGRGLWAGKFTAPWEWRRGGR